MGETLLLLGLSALLVFINGFFVAAEFALVRVRTGRLQELANEGDKKAALALRSTERLDEALAICQLGVTLASLGIGWVGESAFSHLLAPVFEVVGLADSSLRHGISFAVGFSVISATHLVVGEQVPKMFALAQPTNTMRAVAMPLRVFQIGLALPTGLLTWCTDKILSLLGVANDGNPDAPSGDELRRMLASSHVHGSLSEAEREMLDNVFEFGDRSVREVMVPRVDIAFVNVQAPFEDGLALMSSHPFTRYILVEGDLDHVIGMVHSRDLFLARQRGRDVSDFRQVRRDALYLPESNNLDEALRAMQRAHQNLAVVFDEFGSVAGLVTMEDLLEVLVGDIVDEFDPPERDLQRQADGSWLIDGEVPLHEVDEAMGTALESLAEGEYVSIGGLVLDELGRAPQVGDAVLIDSVRCQVEEVQRLRICQVRVVIMPDDDSPADGDANAVSAQGNG